jgi:nucleoside-diphosphate-sugar epimerase
LIDAVFLLAKNQASWGEVYNISGNYDLSTAKMIHRIEETVLKVERNLYNSTLSDSTVNYPNVHESSTTVNAISAPVIKRTKLNGEKILSRVGFIPQFSIDDGLWESAIYYRNKFYKP